MCISDLDAFCKVSACVCVCVHGGSLFRIRSEYPIIILSPVNNGPVYPWSAPVRYLSTLLTLCRSRLNLHRNCRRQDDAAILKICFLWRLKISRLITFDHYCRALWRCATLCGSATAFLGVSGLARLLKRSHVHKSFSWILFKREKVLLDGFHAYVVWSLLRASSSSTVKRA